MQTIESETCPKCGDSLEFCKLGDSNFGLNEKPQEPPVDTEVRICPICGADAQRTRDKGYNFEIMGEKIPVYGVKKVSMNIEKRAITQQTVTFDGWECTNGHKVYTTAKSVDRALCPICRDSLKKFGDLIKTCSHCDQNFETNFFVERDPDELLAEEGWVKVDSIEKKPEDPGPPPEE